MKGKVEDDLPRIKERLSLRYSVVDSIAVSQNFMAEEIAYKSANKYDVIVSLGSDGTLHYVVNGVKKSGFEPIIAVLPYGTCNDVAKTLKIPFKLNKAIDTILRLNTINYDLMYDGDNYIVHTLATGYLISPPSSASPDDKQRFKGVVNAASGIKSAFKPKAFPLTVTCDKEYIRDKAVYFMLINGETANGRRVNPNARLENRKTYMVLVKKRNKFFSLITFIKLFMFGIKSIRKSKSTIIRECSQIEIENHSNIPFTIDGEKVKFLKKHIDVKQSVRMVVR